MKNALKFPIIVSHKVSLKKLSGVIEIKGKIKTGMVRIGFNEVGIFDRKYERTIWKTECKIIFNGDCSIGHGCRLSVGKDGVLSFGKRFQMTANSSIVCEKEISFGNDCLVSWECLFIDNDYHSLYDETGKITNEAAPIIIGDHVWFGCRCTVLKRVVIQNNSVVAAGSIVNRRFSEAGVLIAGHPATIVKRNINWGPREG